MRVNALWVTGSGGGSMVMSKRGSDNVEVMDLLLFQMGASGMKRQGKSLYDYIIFVCAL